jgi:hypothetical protein
LKPPTRGRPSVSGARGGAGGFDRPAGRDSAGRGGGSRQGSSRDEQGKDRYPDRGGGMVQVAGGAVQCRQVSSPGGATVRAKGAYERTAPEEERARWARCLARRRAIRWERVRASCLQGSAGGKTSPHAQQRRTPPSAPRDTQGRVALGVEPRTRVGVQSANVLACLGDPIGEGVGAPGNTEHVGRWGPWVPQASARRPGGQAPSGRGTGGRGGPVDPPSRARAACRWAAAISRAQGGTEVDA